jgi:hypothetical protein
MFSGFGYFAVQRSYCVSEHSRSAAMARIEFLSPREECQTTRVKWLKSVPEPVEDRQAAKGKDGQRV